MDKKNKVDFDAKGFSINQRSYLGFDWKHNLGRQLYDDSAFYKVINDINEVYLAGIEFIFTRSRTDFIGNRSISKHQNKVKSKILERRDSERLAPFLFLETSILVQKA